MAVSEATVIETENRLKQLLMRKRNIDLQNKTTFYVKNFEDSVHELKANWQSTGGNVKAAMLNECYDALASCRDKLSSIDLNNANISYSHSIVSKSHVETSSGGMY